LVLNRADFVATTTGGRGDWELHRRGRACGWPAGWLWDRDPDSITRFNDVRSSDLVFNGKNLQTRGFIKPWRVALMQGGEFIDPIYGGEASGGWSNSYERNGWLGFNSWDGVAEPQCNSPGDIGNVFPWEFYYLVGGPQIENPVYLRRERFWARVPVDGEGAMFAKLTEGTTLSIETGYSRGVNETTTTEYASTVSVGFGGGLTSPIVSFTAAVENSIEWSFGTSVEITEERSVSYTQAVEGRPGKIVIFMLWELVERYTVVDAEGNPYTDPSYEFAPSSGEAEVRGVALALDATEFDAQ
jgi:hypothetical protein